MGRTIHRPTLLKVARCGLAVLLLVVPLTADEAPTANPPMAAVPPDHAQRMQQGLAIFKDTVRGVLVQHCVDCHGGRTTKADFDIATRKALMDSGYVEATAEDSYLMELLHHTAEPHMPFQAAKLDEASIAAIAKWIDLGAPYDRPLVEGRPADTGTGLVITEHDRAFWSFQPLAPGEPPAVDDPTGWVKTPVDRFLLAQQSAQGLAPNNEADRRTLIRRVSFDLTGLPPSPEEVESFLADTRPDAYEHLVDRLLASPRFGERWARHWLDVARFAESSGFEHDYDRPHAYHYRDFVIWAFNHDLPYDRFVQWQLAGDELEPDNNWALAATGFLGAGVFPTQITEAEFELARYEELDDMVATTGVAFLGLSVGCARCHDHKFDPIGEVDYYRMAANFTRTIRSEIERPGDEGPVKMMVTAEGFPHIKHHADGRGYPHFYPETYVLARGDVEQKQEVAQPGFLRVLRGGDEVSRWHREPPEDAAGQFHRATLAAWMTDPKQGAGHLAARVIVNRLWQHYYGTGLVATPNDFGFQGTRPSHPELLDWLAAELIAGGWRLKPIHKLLVTSAGYRQSSELTPRHAEKDLENATFARFQPRRLEAEAIRDALLSVSGELDTSMYGPGIRDVGSSRRSVYFFIKRSDLVGMMMLFDWPEHLVSQGRRAVTTTAPQALFFMNSPHARRWAGSLAKRIIQEAATADDRIQRAFALVLNRPPEADELTLAQAFVDEQLAAHRQANRSDAEHLAWTDLCQTMFALNEFIYLR